jgi:hypothetical protein
VHAAIRGGNLNRGLQREERWPPIGPESGFVPSEVTYPARLLITCACALAWLASFRLPFTNPFGKERKRRSGRAFPGIVGSERFSPRLGNRRAERRRVGYPASFSKLQQYKRTNLASQASSVMHMR